jgi:exosortase
MPRLARYQSAGWGVILAIPFLLFFWRRLDALAVTWVSDGIYSLCPFVPFICLGLIYLDRNHLRALPVSPSMLGLGLVAVCVAETAWFDFKGIGLVFLTPPLLVGTLAGGVLALRGWQTLRALAFPLAFLLFLLPVPPAIMLAIDFPLQALCARTTAGLGNLAGLGLQCAGAQLQFPNPDLSVMVAPACNGLRSTVALLAISAVYAYLLKGPWYRRGVLVALAIPLAYLGNFVRLLGFVGIVSAVGPRCMPYMPRVDAILGFVTFALPLALLFLLARILKCTEFQHIG